MRVPVLTYHGINIHGNAYADNDHVALASDLATISHLGYRIVPLHRLVDALDDPLIDVEDAVAITFDDGSWFDWHDLEHPSHGLQRSFANILRDHRDATGAQVHATSFVIASPDARTILDRTCMVGRGWWGDDWWPEAVREGLVAIESHSFDHNHDTLPRTAQRDQAKGTFRTIDSWSDADAEIRAAADYLDLRCAPHRTTLFAYPYGETNPYLVDAYLPRHAAEHRVRAAFTTSPAPVQRGSNRWMLPRYVCGHDWKSPGELARLLEAA
jgi:peptidoglycan/xylan/chitin deacetylase (PgdA/CDA1 family)